LFTIFSHGISLQFEHQQLLKARHNFQAKNYCDGRKERKEGGLTLIFQFVNFILFLDLSLVRLNQGYSIFDVHNAWKISLSL